MARGVSPPQAFKTVAGEPGSLIGADYAAISASRTVLASRLPGR
jgi:hypothetical protein